MIRTSTRLPPIQRLVEIKHVAEQLHFKVSTLLLHGGKIIEAVTWFRQHNASYKRLIGAPEAIYLHWEWMSRQFLVFAELLETSSATTQSISSIAADNPDRGLTEWEFRPAYYYQVQILLVSLHFEEPLFLICMMDHQMQFRSLLIKLCHTYFSCIRSWLFVILISSYVIT